MNPYTISLMTFLLGYALGNRPMRRKIMGWCNTSLKTGKFTSTKLSRAEASYEQAMNDLAKAKDADEKVEAEKRVGEELVALRKIKLTRERFASLVED
jgi:hypothetical protein